MSENSDVKDFIHNFNVRIVDCCKTCTWWEADEFICKKADMIVQPFNVCDLFENKSFDIP